MAASPAEYIGEVVSDEASELILRDRGDEEVRNLGDLAISSEEHYTDSRQAYEATTADLREWLDKPIWVQGQEGAATPLQSFSIAEEICKQVDDEYGATVTPRLQETTGNPDHKVPELDPVLVYASYVSLSAGGTVVLPTSVGNIVAAASDRALNTMFVVKERDISKAGVVLTTMDEITNMADVPEGWEGYLKYMHEQGILTGSKLHRNNDHPLFANQPEWSRDNSQFDDGTSMFVFLPGPYSDAVARLLARDNKLLTASSANKSKQGNNRDIATLHRDIRAGTDFVAWDPHAVSDYHLANPELASQGVMVDFRPYSERYLAARERFNDILEHIGETSEISTSQRFHIIRSGFMQEAFMLHSINYLGSHPELEVSGFTGHVKNIADQTNKLQEKLAA